jgi:hypothetical protein
LVKLQSQGVTEDQMLYMSKQLEKNSASPTTTMQEFI